MARIEGVHLPDNKRIEYALPYLFGIGVKTARVILKEAGVNLNTRSRDLKPEEVAEIQKIISRNYRVEGELRKEIAMNVRRLQEIRCYRGDRHKRDLPVRGQRTKTNARTAKGPRRETIALKKKVSKK